MIVQINTPSADIWFTWNAGVMATTKVRDDEWPILTPSGTTL